MPDTSPAPDALYLEDLVVGQRTPGGGILVTKADITAFAAQFDPQFFHLDDQAARSSLFGGLAASGWHVAAMTMRMIVDSVKIAGGLIGAGSEVAWPLPTRAGDTLSIESEIISITPSRSRPDRGIVVSRTTTFNQHGEAVQILTAKLVVPRRPARAAGAP